MGDEQEGSSANDEANAKYEKSFMVPSKSGIFTLNGRDFESSVRQFDRVELSRELSVERVRNDFVSLHLGGAACADASPEALFFSCDSEYSRAA